METITTTTYVIYFSSGGQGAIVATASFGDVLIIMLLFFIALVQIISMGVVWRHSLFGLSHLRRFTSWGSTLLNSLSISSDGSGEQSDDT